MNGSIRTLAARPYRKTQDPLGLSATKWRTKNVTLQFIQMYFKYFIKRIRN